jgi:hypothetical protein
MSALKKTVQTPAGISQKSKITLVQDKNQQVHKEQFQQTPFKLLVGQSQTQQSIEEAKNPTSNKLTQTKTTFYSQATFTIYQKGNLYHIVYSDVGYSYFDQLKPNINNFVIAIQEKYSIVFTKLNNWLRGILSWVSRIIHGEKHPENSPKLQIEEKSILNFLFSISIYRPHHHIASGIDNITGDISSALNISSSFNGDYIRMDDFFYKCFDLIFQNGNRNEATAFFKNLSQQEGYLTILHNGISQLGYKAYEHSINNEIPKEDWVFIKETIRREDYNSMLPPRRFLSDLITGNYIHASTKLRESMGR